VNAVFVTGTDTGCGKTSVGCALARGLRAAGLRVRVLKPVETGCAERGGSLVPADALALAAAAGDDAPLEQLCPYPLALAAAPEVAAREAGIELDPEHIAAALARARAHADAVLVEGAGGLLVPLGPELDMAGLARRLALPLIVVARARLGTLNHSLLTLEAAAARGLRVAGVAFSHDRAVLASAELRNLDALRARLARSGVPCLGELGHGAELLAPEPAPRALLDALGAVWLK
jgi:dethiobiotin synthetase